MHYKITNEEEKHYGYQYKTGLNILDGNFDYSGSCCEGGFYFTELKYIHEYYDYGIYIREVILPKSDPDFVMAKNPSGNKWRANKIVLGKRYSLFDPSTYTELGITRYPKWLIDEASKNNYLDALYLQTQFNLPYTEFAIDHASANGHIGILDWWLAAKESGIVLKYSEDAIDYASRHGHLSVLQWWAASGLTIRYSRFAIDRASENGHVDVLQWWKQRYVDNQTELKYTIDAIDYASYNGHKNVLNWWKDSALKLRYSKRAIDYASRYSDIDILQWWLDYKTERPNLTLEYSNDAIDYASRNGHIRVLQWWLNSGLPMKYSKCAIISAHMHNNDDVINWWEKSDVDYPEIEEEDWDMCGCDCCQ